MDLNEAEQLAKDLIKQYNIPYSFAWNNSYRYIGRCSCSKHIIYLSKAYTLLNSIDQIKDTILHEIAHALAPISENHGTKWKKIAISLGCIPKACVERETVIVPFKYIGHCIKCFKEFKVSRRTRIACRSCCKTYNNGKFSDQFLIEWDL